MGNFMRSQKERWSKFHFSEEDVDHARSHGLPWLLDFKEHPTGFHVMSSNILVQKVCFEDAPNETCDSLAWASNIHFRNNCLEWLAAIKYFLYLTLAPEPDRTRLRDHWRQLRVKMFADLQPTTTEAKRLYQQLRNRKPLPVPKDDVFSKPEMGCAEVIHNLYYAIANQACICGGNGC